MLRFCGKTQSINTRRKKNKLRETHFCICSSCFFDFDYIFKETRERHTNVCVNLWTPKTSSSSEILLIAKSREISFITHTFLLQKVFGMVGKDTRPGMRRYYYRGATCVQRFDDSLSCAIRITYRSSQRSSSLHEPRDPPLKVVKILF